MRILITSMPKTGGHWLYNATRLICEQNGKTMGYQDKTYLAPFAPFVDFEVIKCDAFAPDYIWESIVLTTTRDPFDYAQPDQYKDLLERYHDHAKWCSYANLILEYKEIKTNEHKCVQQVAFAIDLDCEVQTVVNELKNIKAPSHGFDRKTLLKKGQEI